MKKLLLISLIAAVLIASGIYGYKRYSYANYPERLFKNITHVAAYTMRSTIHNDHDTYMEATISESDKERLLNEMKFRTYPTDWLLKRTCGFIPDNDRGFLYYAYATNQKLHGYTLCFLQPKTNVVIVYEYRER